MRRRADPGLVAINLSLKELSQASFVPRCRDVFEKHGVRKYGVIRVDSAEFGVNKWRENPKANTAKIAETLRSSSWPSACW